MLHRGWVFIWFCIITALHFHGASDCLFGFHRTKMPYRSAFLSFALTYIVEIRFFSLHAVLTVIHLLPKYGDDSRKPGKARLPRPGRKRGVVGSGLKRVRLIESLALRRGGIARVNLTRLFLRVVALVETPDCPPWNPQSVVCVLGLTVQPIKAFYAGAQCFYALHLYQDFCCEIEF